MCDFFPIPLYTVDIPGNWSRAIPVKLKNKPPKEDKQEVEEKKVEKEVEKTWSVRVKEEKYTPSISLEEKNMA